MLVEKNEIVPREEIMANIINNYFTNITIHLKLKCTKINHKANLESIINAFQNHESVQRIKLANFHSKSSLKFNNVSELDVKKEILNLSSKIPTRKGDISTKILKNNITAYVLELKLHSKSCLKKAVSPHNLKLAIGVILKKEGSLKTYAPLEKIPMFNTRF